MIGRIALDIINVPPYALNAILNDMIEELAHTFREAYNMSQKIIKYEKMERELKSKYYEYIKQAVQEQAERYRNQKRQIKQMIEDQVVRITPGYPISKLLRVDNTP